MWDLCNVWVSEPAGGVDERLGWDRSGTSESVSFF